MRPAERPYNVQTPEILLCIVAKRAHPGPEAYLSSGDPVCMLHHPCSCLREDMRTVNDIVLVRILSWWRVVVVGWGGEVVG